MVERQLRCDLLRLILVAGWFVPFWRDTARLCWRATSVEGFPLPPRLVSAAADGPGRGSSLSRYFPPLDRPRSRGRLGGRRNEREGPEPACGDRSIIFFSQCFSYHRRLKKCQKCVQGPESQREPSKTTRRPRCRLNKLIPAVEAALADAGKAHTPGKKCSQGMT